jgi:hypothetical protein
MSDDRKYRQRGYQDSGSSSGPRSRGPQAPPPKKEGPRGRGLGAPTDTVFRCNKCGEKRPIADPIEIDTVCKKCGADLHTCSNCIHFDTGVRWECRKFEEIPAHVLKKSTRNECPLFEPKTVQEFNRDGGKPSPGDARSAFDALFKL